MCGRQISCVAYIKASYAQLRPRYNVHVLQIFGLGLGPGRASGSSHRRTSGKSNLPPPPSGEHLAFGGLGTNDYRSRVTLNRIE